MSISTNETMLSGFAMPCCHAKDRKKAINHPLNPITRVQKSREHKKSSPNLISSLIHRLYDVNFEETVDSLYAELMPVSEHAKRIRSRAQTNDPSSKSSIFPVNTNFGPSRKQSVHDMDIYTGGYHNVTKFLCCDNDVLKNRVITLYYMTDDEIPTGLIDDLTNNCLDYTFAIFIRIVSGFSFLESINFPDRKHVTIHIKYLIVSDNRAENSSNIGRHRFEGLFIDFVSKEIFERVSEVVPNPDPTVSHHDKYVRLDDVTALELSRERDLERNGGLTHDEMFELTLKKDSRLSTREKSEKINSYLLKRVLIRDLIIISMIALFIYFKV
jgi:hypothetical protein